MRVLHTCHSNAIEGNTLTLSETKRVLSTGITIGGKTLREHLETTNNAQGYDLIVRLAREQAPITHITIQQVHEVVTRGILLYAGCYRTHNVRITGAVRSPPDGKKIIPEMDRLIQEIAQHDRPVIEMTAYLHHRFVLIHPFTDGNGRVARLSGNLYLIRNGFPRSFSPTRRGNSITRHSVRQITAIYPHSSCSLHTPQTKRSPIFYRFSGIGKPSSHSVNLP